jgi:hypothetical protein
MNMLLDRSGIAHRSQTLELVKCLNCLRSIHDRRAGAHIDCHSHGFHYFVAGSTLFYRGLCMECDTRVASGCDRNSEGDQFLGFDIQRLRFPRAREPKTLPSRLVFRREVP